MISSDEITSGPKPRNQSTSGVLARYSFLRLALTPTPGRLRQWAQLACDRHCTVSQPFCLRPGQVKRACELQGLQPRHGMKQLRHLPIRPRSRSLIQAYTYPQGVDLPTCSMCHVLLSPRFDRYGKTAHRDHRGSSSSVRPDTSISSAGVCSCVLVDRQSAGVREH